MSDNEKQASVPFFVHEATMDKMDTNNKRMLIALVTVCLTLIITVPTKIPVVLSSRRSR